MLRRVAFFLYGALSYCLFLGVFVYAIGFVSGLVVPKDIDDEIARLKLESMDVECDTLTDEQAAYLASWDQGT